MFSVYNQSFTSTSLASTNIIIFFTLGETSIGIPHKEAAVRCCDVVHPLAKVKFGHLEMTFLFFFFYIYLLL